MKSEERHHLKTNDLAETLGHIPEYIKQYGSQALTIVIVLLIILVGYSWYNRVSTANAVQRQGRLQELLGSPDQLQQQAIRHAMAQDSGEAVDLDTLEGYSTETLKRGLAELTDDAAGTPVGAKALLTQADTVRSELYFSDKEISDAEKAQTLSSAEQLYNRALREYFSDTNSVLAAKLGLAMVAEDKGQWDVARAIYEEIVNEQDCRYAGYPGVLVAESRLDRMADFTNAPTPVAVEVPAELPTETAPEAETEPSDG